MRLLLLTMLVLLAQCQTMAPENTLKFNEIQFLGSHNSYKKAIDPGLLGLLREADPALAASLDYAHKPLAEQLELGMRQLELDVFHDPKGGRYTAPYGLQAVESSSPFDSAAMDEPGFKVFHVQDIDFRSHCPLFTDCLAEVVAWSNEHPGHLPLVITINAKSDVIDSPQFTTPLPFDSQAWADLDREIRNGVGDKLFSPDDQRGDLATLRQAVLAGWPLLDDLRGRIMFVLDDSDEKIESYIAGHPSLQGRAMFVDAPEDTPEASFRIVNDPQRRLAYIQALVRQGFIVRTRADADTVEARNADRSRLDAAMASGAQIISTDYYEQDPRFEGGYTVSLPGGVVARCNPVIVHGPCKIAF